MGSTRNHARLLWAIALLCVSGGLALIFFTSPRSSPAEAAPLPTSAVTCRTYKSSDLSVPISSNDPTSVTSTILVDQPGWVQSVRLKTDITHISPRNLSIDLTMPNACASNVMVQGQASNEAIAGVINWADNAPQPITYADYPYTNKTFKPNTPFLSSNTLASGLWRLHIVDYGGDEGGVLNSWGLTICSGGAQPTATPIPPPPTQVSINECANRIWAHEGTYYGTPVPDPGYGHPVLDYNQSTSNGGGLGVHMGYYPDCGWHFDVSGWAEHPGTYLQGDTVPFFSYIAADNRFRETFFPPVGANPARASGDVSDISSTEINTGPWYSTTGSFSSGAHLQINGCHFSQATYDYCYDLPGVLPQVCGAPYVPPTATQRPLPTPTGTLVPNPAPPTPGPTATLCYCTP